MKFTQEQLKKINTVAKVVEENPEMSLINVTRDDFLAGVKELNQLNSDFKQTKLELFEIKRDRDELLEKTSETAKNVTNLIEIYFGSNSKELKEAGRKVKSERKKHVRKTLDEQIEEAAEKFERLKAKAEKRKEKALQKKELSESK